MIEQINNTIINHLVTNSYLLAKELINICSFWHIDECESQFLFLYFTLKKSIKVV